VQDIAINDEPDAGLGIRAKHQQAIFRLVLENRFLGDGAVDFGQVGGRCRDSGNVRQEQGEDERKLAHWFAPPGDKTPRNCHKIRGWALHHCENSQTSAVPSPLPETRRFPSAEKATDQTESRCPARGLWPISRKLATSHRRTV